MTLRTFLKSYLIFKVECFNLKKKKKKNISHILKNWAKKTTYFAENKQLAIG